MSIENPNSVEHKEKDSGYEANLDSLDAKFLETQKKIQRLTQLDPNEGKEYGSKRRFLKSLISYSLSASMMLAGIAEVQRYVTRYNVHKTGQGVEAVFEHQDSETTFWIDYLKNLINFIPMIVK